MFILMVSLTNVLAAELSRCQNLKQLHDEPFHVPKVYAPKLYALQKIPYSVLKEGGVKDNAEWIISDHSIWLSNTEAKDEFMQTVVETLWPKAVSYTLRETMYIETTHGQWTMRTESGGLLLSTQGQKPDIPSFWGEAINGCQLGLSSVNIPYSSNLFQGKRAVLAYRYNDAKIQLKVEREGTVPKAFRKKPAVFPSVGTTQKPQVAMSFGESPIALLRESGIGTAFQMSEKDLKAIERKLNVPSGAVAAQFSDGGMAAAIPVRGWFGCKTPAWQLWWGVKSALKRQTFEKTAKHTLRFVMDGKEMHLFVEKGMIFIASSQVLLSELVDNSTPTWFADTVLEEKWNVVGRTELPPSLFLLIGPLQRIDLGLSMYDGAWVLQFRPYTSSKAPPQRLFLGYFATLQSSLMPVRRDTPPSAVDIVLKKVAQLEATWMEEQQRHLVWAKNTPPPEALVDILEEKSISVWVEDAEHLRIFAEASNGDVWVREKGLTMPYQDNE
ncbi:MAG: hypothetical protein VX278_20090 [Myxococcota bacterium]|nr:hypothetical protein [Myxococcota bacterium]